MKSFFTFTTTHRRMLAVGVALLMVGGFLLSAVFTQAESATLVVTAGQQPPVKTLLSGDQVVTFTVVNLTAVGGDVAISNMSMDQVGVASDSVFSAVQFRELATGQHLGRAKALPGSGVYNSYYDMVIKEGESKDIILIANVGSLASYNNQYPQLALTGIDTKAEIEGTFPIVGTAHKTNGNITAGTASIAAGPGDPKTGNTVTADEEGVLFNSMRVTATSAEPVVPAFTIWHYSASASYEHLSDVYTEIVYKGQTYTFPTFPYATGSDPNEQWISVLAGAPVIAEGDSYVMNIRGTVSSKALNETIDFVDFAKAGVYHAGVYYGALTVAGAIYDSPASTVSGGSTLIASSHPTNTWYQNNPEIQQFAINNDSDETVKIYGLELDLDIANTNVRIWDKKTGEVVAGPMSTGTDGFVELASLGNWSVPVGGRTFVITADKRASVEGEVVLTMKPATSAAMFRVKTAQ